MRKVIFLIALLAIGIFPQKTFAQEIQAGASAKLLQVTENNINYSDSRIVALENIFKKYDSPLSGLAPIYIRYADKYGVDWRLLPAISGLESSFGKLLMPGSYNAYGWGGGYIYFDSWENGIDSINNALRENYINRGADDVWSIGPIYAESPTWSVRVNSFINEINTEYIKVSSNNVAINL